MGWKEVAIRKLNFWFSSIYFCESPLLFNYTTASTCHSERQRGISVTFNHLSSVIQADLQESVVKGGIPRIRFIKN